MDKEVNNFGRARDLINFCKSYGMHILNGRVSGNITGVANRDCSVGDYMLLNTGLYSFIQHF